MKLKHSLVALATLTTLSFAGGDINPVTVFEAEPAPVAVEPVLVPVAPKPVPVAPKPVPVVVAPAAKNFYVGLGATRIRNNIDAQTVNGTTYLDSRDYQTGLTARVGYDFMNYLGAELRGTAGLYADDGITKVKQFGAYLKPNVDLMDGLNLYGLLGASSVNQSDLSTNNPSDKLTGFSYGLGLDYGITDSVSVFVDVMNYLQKSDTTDLYGATLGAAYHF